MKYVGRTGLMLLLAIWAICACERSYKPELGKLTQADSIWISFMTQMENGNVEFLLENSLDTIQCVDCNIESGGQSEFYDSDLIFNHHLGKLKHLKSLRDKEF